MLILFVEAFGISEIALDNASFGLKHLIFIQENLHALTTLIPTKRKILIVKRGLQLEPCFAFKFLLETVSLISFVTH